MTFPEASCCHPFLPSSSLSWERGRRPCADGSHSGASKPISWRWCLALTAPSKWQEFPPQYRRGSGSSHFLVRTFLCLHGEGRCFQLCVFCILSSDVAVHAAQRMDGDGDSQYPMGGFQVIRGPRPPSVRWPSVRSFVSGTVKPNSTQSRAGGVRNAPGSNRGGVGECQEACFGI